LSSSFGLCEGEGRPVKVEYTLTPEDYVAAIHEHVQNSLGKPRRAQYVSMAAPFLGLLSLGAMLVAQGVPWPVAAGVSLFGLLLGVLCFVLFPRLIFKRLTAGAFRRARIPATSMGLEVRPEGLAVTTRTTASLSIWEGIDRIVVSDAHAFFYRNNVATHILPRRVFADERDFEEFVESARSYQEAAKRSSEAKRLLEALGGFKDCDRATDHRLLVESVPHPASLPAKAHGCPFRRPP
jgi:hypothetical protein